MSRGERVWRVYGHMHDGKVFYVGCGLGDRAIARHNRSKTWHQFVDNHGGTFDVRIFLETADRDTARIAEADLIDHYWKSGLVNRKHGTRDSDFTVRPPRRNQTPRQKYKGVELTTRQIEILQWCESYISEYGYGPTCAGSAQARQWKSPNAASEQFKALERLGAISRRRGVSRSMRVLV